MSILGDAKVIAAAHDRARAVAPRTSGGRLAAADPPARRGMARRGTSRLRNSDAAPMRPERICKEISDALPPDGVVVSDTGHAGIWTAGMIELHHPGQSYFRTAGSLGWGFPAALGVKCALPDRPVVCFTGDGGFYYHIAELETARRHNINLRHRGQQQQRAQPGDPPQRHRLWRQAARPRRGDVALSRTSTSPRSRRRSAASGCGSSEPGELNATHQEGDRA